MKSIRRQRNAGRAAFISANTYANIKKSGVTCIYCRDYFPNKKKQKHSFICNPCGKNFYKWGKR